MGRDDERVCGLDRPVDARLGFHECSLSGRAHSRCLVYPPGVWALTQLIRPGKAGVRTHVHGRVQDGSLLWDGGTRKAPSAVAATNRRADARNARVRAACSNSPAACHAATAPAPDGCARSMTTG